MSMRTKIKKKNHDVPPKESNYKEISSNMPSKI